MRASRLQSVHHYELQHDSSGRTETGHLVRQWRGRAPEAVRQPEAPALRRIRSRGSGHSKRSTTIMATRKSAHRYEGTRPASAAERAALEIRWPAEGRSVTTCCGGCRALEAELGSDRELLEFYKSRLLKRG
jgi:hypothetical protein